MSEVIGSVQVVVRPDTTGFADKARDGVEREFRRKNVLELDFEMDPENVRQDVEDSLDATQQWLDLKKNALKIQARLAWKKADLVAQLREFKTDVEVLEKLNRPTVYADFEIDRHGLSKLAETVKLNVGLDEKTLNRAIKSATKDISVFGDKKAVEEKAETMATITGNIFENILKKRRLSLEVKADRTQLEEMRGSLATVYRHVDEVKAGAFDLEDALADVTAEAKKQEQIITSLSEEWEEVRSNSIQNRQYFAAITDELEEAEGRLASLNKMQDTARRKQQLYAKNMLGPSLDNVRELQREFDELNQKINDKDVSIKATAERVSFAAVAAELSAMARDRVVLFWAKVQNLSVKQMASHWDVIADSSKRASVNVAKWIGQLTGVRVLWRTFTDMVEILPKLDMAVPLIAKNLGLIALATAGAIGGVGVLFTLVSDLAQVSKLVVGLPAVLVGVSGSALILGRALHDFKEVFPDIISYYKQLGGIVSDKVWEKAEAPVRKLHRALEPLLSSLVPSWASAWGESLGALAEGIGSANSLGNLGIFLKNSITGTKNARDGWESLGNAIMSLVGGGSDVFPGLGDWFSETMEDFETWAGENQAHMGRWLREGATALGEFGSIVVDTIKTVGGIAEAFDAAGWPGLTELADGMRTIAENAQNLSENAEFMFMLENTRDFFKEMKTLGPQASRALSNSLILVGKGFDILAEPIAGMLDGILAGFNSEKFQTGFTDFMEGVGSFITDVTPGVQGLTEDIGSLLGVVGSAAESWGPGFNSMLEMFTSAGDNLHPGLIEFIENTGPDLNQLVQDITPHVEDFAQAISDLLGNEGFQEFVGDVLTSFGDLAGKALDLATAMTDLLEAFSDWYGSLGPGAQQTVVWATIIGAAFSGVALAIGGILGKAAVSGLATAALAPLRTLFSKLLTGFKGIVIRFATSAAGVLALPVLLSSFIKPLGAVEVVNTLLELIGWDDNWLGKFFSELEQRFSNIFGDRTLLDIVGDHLKASWKAFIGGDIGEAIDQLFQALTPMDFIAAIVPALLRMLGVGETTQRNVEEIMQGYIEGGFSGFFSAWWRVLKRTVSDLWNMALDNIENWEPTTGLGKAGKWFADKVMIPFLSWVFGVDKDGNTVDAGGANALGATPAQTAAMGDNIQRAMDKAWAAIEVAIDAGLAWLEDQIANWEPTSGAGKFMKDLLGRLPGLLGLDENGDFSWETFGDSWADYGKVLWEDHIKPLLQDGWDYLVDEFKKWEPVAAIIDFIDDPFGTILGWLGIGAGWLAGKALSLPSDAASWGSTVWNDHLKPWLDDGWADLNGGFSAWDPSAEEAPEGKIDLGHVLQKVRENFFGADPAADTASAFSGAFDQVIPAAKAAMAQGVQRMREQIKMDGAPPEEGGLLGKYLGLDTTSVGTVSVNASTAGNSIGALSDRVSRDYSTMGESAATRLGELVSNSGRSFTNVNTTGSRQVGGLSSNVKRDFTSMSTESQNQTGQLESGVTSKLESTKVAAESKAAQMARHYVAQMRKMMVDAVRVAESIRRLLPSILQFSAHGAGRHVGATFVQGLASGLSRAASIAYGYRGSIRNALTFSAYSSGSTVGGTFAAGLRSRRGAVSSAAYALARAARATLPNSPAAEGPFSGAGWGGWGESIADELARGMREGAPAVAREASRMMSLAAEELNRTPQVEFSPDVRAMRSSLEGVQERSSGSEPLSNIINVNVESNSEDPLQDGARLGNALDFALRGARYK